MMRAISTTIADLPMLNRLMAYAAGTPRIRDSTVDHSATQKLLKMKSK